MKSIVTLILGAFLVFAGCDVQPQGEMSPENPTLESNEMNEDNALSQSIEDLSAYKPLEGVEKKFFAQSLTVCNEGGEELVTAIWEGEISYLEVYDSGETNYNLTLYKTPNYEAWENEQDLEEYSECMDGVGLMTPVKFLNDEILWSYPYCSGGATPSPDEERYDDFQDCLVVQNQLQDYLNQ